MKYKVIDTTGTARTLQAINIFDAMQQMLNIGVVWETITKLK